MKIFATSDIHSFFDQFIKALNEAGFEKGNSEHLLVVCGDVFDRGPNSYKVMEYLNSVPNKVLVKGNHESLIVDCIERREPWGYDYSNGTYRTIMDLGRHYLPYEPTFDEACYAIERPVKKFISQMVNYYETENYVFVHSWIPLKCEDTLPFHYTKHRNFSYMENWREASKDEWEQARWVNPFTMAYKNLNPKGTTIVFGHWHSSYAWAAKEERTEFGEDAKFDAFYGNGYIALDACTAHSGQVNVVVLEDTLIGDKGENDDCNIN